jgi:DNA-directed RNA polymerase specialized sigma24 family protein
MKDMLVQVEPLIPALRRYARALLRNRANADDLVQDCLERAVSRWHQRRDGSVRAWLFTILHNLAADQFRRASSRGRHVPIKEAGEGEFRGAAAQEHRLMYQEYSTSLRNCRGSSGPYCCWLQSRISPMRKLRRY